MRYMNKLSCLILAVGLFCSCQQAPRNILQKDVPIFTKTTKTIKIRRGKKIKRETIQVNMVSVSGPEAKEWDVFDRGDAVMKYNNMPVKDKELLFETVARTYYELPLDNTLPSEVINIGIWKAVSDKGVDLAFGEEPADWNPYLMYIHPIVIAEMTNFFINAKDSSITDEELNQWQKAGCNVINSIPDSISMAAMLARRADLEKAGIIITETAEGFKAHTSKVDWQKYRAEHNQ